MKNIEWMRPYNISGAAGNRQFHAVALSATLPPTRVAGHTNLEKNHSIFVHIHTNERRDRNQNAYYAGPTTTI